MSRFRLTAYVSDSVAERLAMASKRKGFNRSKIVDRALDRFLAGDGSQGNDTSLQRRLDNMSKQQARTERNIAVAPGNAGAVCPLLPHGDTASAEVRAGPGPQSWQSAFRSLCRPNRQAACSGSKHGARCDGACGRQRSRPLRP